MNEQYELTIKQVSKYKVFHPYGYKRKWHFFSAENVILILKIASESYGNTIFSEWIPNIASF